jgi:hypothetical protein
MFLSSLEFLLLFENAALLKKILTWGRESSRQVQDLNMFCTFILAPIVTITIFITWICCTICLRNLLFILLILSFCNLSVPRTVKTLKLLCSFSHFVLNLWLMLLAVRSKAYVCRTPLDEGSAHRRDLYLTFRNRGSYI